MARQPANFLSYGARSPHPHPALCCSRRSFFGCTADPCRYRPWLSEAPPPSRAHPDEDDAGDSDLVVPTRAQSARRCRFCSCSICVVVVLRRCCVSARGLPLTTSSSQLLHPPPPSLLPLLPFSVLSCSSAPVASVPRQTRRADWRSQRRQTRRGGRDRGETQHQDSDRMGSRPRPSHGRLWHDCYSVPSLVFTNRRFSLRQQTHEPRCGRG